MLHRVLRIGHWVVDFLFSTGTYDNEAILAILYDYGASDAVIGKAKRIMDLRRMNRGFTFANPDRKKALVVIGPTTSGRQFQNTLVHEIHHLAVAIAKSIGYDLGGEGPAYLAGDSLMAFADVVCRLGCENCN